LNLPCTFHEFIEAQRPGTLMLAHCDQKAPRKSIPEVYKKGSDAVILIGPEGDFSKEEIERAMSKNFTQIHLGSSRLRTETAGVAACHSIYFINQ
jgi:16S rRNA (uracil1498-N3)-methyltransferase